MALPAALAPLRHRLFRVLWLANVVVSLGVWMQNTGAGWLMATLTPDALMVSMVQAATITPVFLLALPAGAIGDIVDRRLLILVTQTWMLGSAALLTGLTLGGVTGPWGLLALTFAIGLGSAINNPSWGSVMAEAVPRADLAQAIALNGVGFNLARAVGPAIAGFLLLAGGPGLTFGLNALTYLAVIGVLITWHRRRRTPALPPEKLSGAMRAGVRFVRHTPSMRAAMIRAAAFFAPCAGPWGVLPLVVREQLHLGAGFYGTLLGLMGIGGVTAGLLLPQLRNRASRGAIVFGATLISCAGMAMLSLATHWLVASVAMYLFGLGWVAAASITQGAAQLAAPAWVRSRALAIYQLASNFALAGGTFFWGWVGTKLGLSTALMVAAGIGALIAVAARSFRLDSGEATSGPVPARPASETESIAPELVPVLGVTRDRVMETQHYHVDPARKDAFLAAMIELRDVRGRAGAILWNLGEDISNPNHWVELWWMESWTDHLREAGRLSDDDRAALGRAMDFDTGSEPLKQRRYLMVNPSRPDLG
jgi:MFS family permease